MSAFYKFASESPWLTFFLACIVAQMLVSIFRAIFGREDCDCSKEDEDENENKLR